MLDPGEPVLWRKRWNGVVMTALPMRVVSEPFQRAVADGHLTADVEERVRAEAERMTSVLAADGPPFCESEWLRWRPPADWTVPALPADWAH